MNNYATNPNEKLTHRQYAVLNILVIFFILTLMVSIIAAYRSCEEVESVSYDTVADVLSTENNEVLMVDGAGDVWAVSARPDLNEGDFVRIYFDDNGTDYTKRDDVIVKLEKLDN